MLVERPLELRFVVAMTLIAAGWSVTAETAEEDVPDMEFLEYLGSWEGEEDDWVWIAATAENETESEAGKDDPAPQGDQVAELEDEG